MSKIQRVMVALCVCVMLFNYVGGNGIYSVDVSAETVEQIADTTILHSGISGSLNWSIDSSGCLTISGSGDFECDTEYDSCVLPEWVLYNELISSAVVNVTDMGYAESMFDHLYFLKNVKFEKFETVNNEIYGLFMFYECRNLESVDFSACSPKVAKDVSFMFSGCTKLTSINISNWDMSNLEYCDDMLTQCTNLNKINVPLNLSYEIILPDGNWYDNNNVRYFTLPYNLTNSIELNNNNQIKEYAEVEINGFQISSSAEGIRTVYSVSNPNKDVVSAGLIYGLVDYATIEDMKVGTKNKVVYNFKATKSGQIDSSMCSEFTQLKYPTTYVMTMTFGEYPVEYFAEDTMVRAYAKLSDGTYIYSPVSIYRVYDVAEQIYINNWMNNKSSHSYLYTDILVKVNPNYKEVGFVANNALVKP